MLRAEDHQKRLDRLIWDGLTDAARHMLPLVSADYRLAAEARLGLAADAANGEALLVKVPAQLRSDPGVAFEEARWRRKKNNYEAAAQLLLAHADSPVRPAAWWGERQLVTRQLLATGNADTAYKLAQRHGLSDGNAYSGRNSCLATSHCATAGIPPSPWTISPTHPGARNHALARRAAYWSGRAAGRAATPSWRQSGMPPAPRTWRRSMANSRRTNSARTRRRARCRNRSRAAPSRSTSMPRSWSAPPGSCLPPATATTPGVSCCRWPTRQRPRWISRCWPLAEIAGRIDLAIAVAKRSIEAGTPLMVHGYPVTALPDGGTAERSLLFAIVRQKARLRPRR
jgi:soluble lytic murein transglycosylase